MVFAQESGESVDPEQFEAGVRSAVKETVRKQMVAGVDVVNDGEVSKPSYATYVKDRLTGFGGEGSIETVAASVMDLEEFPDFADHLAATMESVSEIRFTTCDGPVAYVGQDCRQERHREPEGGARRRGAGRHIHERGISRRDRRVLTEPVLLEPGGVPRGALDRDA